MIVRSLGGCSEVGRLSLQFETKNERFLLDYGVNVQNMHIPLKPDMPVDGVFLSHAHLDHCGVLPKLYSMGYRGAVYGTHLTLELADLLLVDSMKVQERRGLVPQFHLGDLERMESLETPVSYKQNVDFKTASFELWNAGHVPGSSSILVNAEDKNVLYTGDINFIDTELVRKADTNFKNLDAVFCEATYYYKNHPDRRKLSANLRKHAEEVVAKNGSLLLPCFAIGRTQEMLITLADMGIPIYIDGMGIAATKMILSYPDMVADFRKLNSAFEQAHKVSRERQRKDAIRKPSIIITTAGMLNGGPIHYYIKKLYRQENCSLVMTGFQVPGTAGRTLLDTGRYVANGLEIKPKMHMEFMDFSAHCGRDDIITFLEKTNPKKVFPVHCDGAEEFSKELQSLGFDSHAPVNDEKIRI